MYPNANASDPSSTSRDVTMPLKVHQPRSRSSSNASRLSPEECHTIDFDMSPFQSGADSGFYPTPPPEQATPLSASPCVSSPLTVNKCVQPTPGPRKAPLRQAYSPPSSNKVCEQLEKVGIVESSENEWKPLEMSQHARDTVNPIRAIVDVMSVEPNPKKSLIKLHLGDPTLTGTMNAHPTSVQAITDSVHSQRFNGYAASVGNLEVRRALMEHVTHADAPVTEDDIILTSGCSHALQLAIEALAGPRQNILVPKPGFPLYSTLMKPHGIEDRHYNLLMDRDWEIDLDQMESLIDVNTRAIIVNNPSNPCGAVYSKQHLTDILRLAEKHRLVIIADEIYGDLTYDGAVFHPLAQLTPKVPILCCDGIAKRYLVPGWRLGWVIVHDRFGALKSVKEGLKQLANKIVGPCAIVQGALPAMLKNTPTEFFDGIKEILSKNAKIAYDILQATPGLHPIRPKGAMYMMVGIDSKRFPSFPNEMQLLKQLIVDESVYCLPGSAFGAPGWFRLVLTYPEAVTRDACERIKAFCLSHSLASKPINQAFAQAFTTVTTPNRDLSHSPPNHTRPVPRNYSVTQMS